MNRPAAGVILVPEGQGRAYAAVAGDVNPIHLHALTAKAMGFPRAIAHGMWTYARALAVLGPATAGPSRSHAWFGKPVLLPSTVELVVDDGSDPAVVGLRSRSHPTRTHLTVIFAGHAAPIPGPVWTYVRDGEGAGGGGRSGGVTGPRPR